MKCTQIISSYNRPAQLDLLLRSCQEHWPEHNRTIIIWKSSNEFYHKGYEKLINKYLSGNYIDKGYAFIHESDYKRNLLYAIQHDNISYILMNSDDNVFVDRVNFRKKELFNNEIAFSLRLGKGLNRCEPAKRSMAEPQLIDDWENMIKWDWTKGADKGVCYYYPCPYDSNIYSKDWLLNIIKDKEFKNPYELENVLNTNRDFTKPYMVSFKEPKLISLMANTTGQNDNPNMKGKGQSIEELNQKWLDGYRLSTKGLYGMQTKQCHVYHEYKLEKDV